MLNRAIPVCLAMSACLGVLAGCRSTGSREVAGLLAGSYTSAEQAKADPEFLEVHLHMARIWPARTDGEWLYVEQAMASALDKPYRQRIYQLVDAGEGAVLSTVYELPNAADRIGAWRAPGVFDADSPEALVARDGCAIRLVRDGDAWRGSTNGKDCLSSLRGASYATSDVVLAHERLQTWDRGFDANDQQVWGAKKGPYVFVKEPPRTP
jgi:hypothetical protein